MSCYCDYDPPEFYLDTSHKARKKHRCYECDGDINVGEIYRKSVGVWDGSFSDFKQCSKCVSLIELMTSHIKCFCWSFGSLINDAYEHINESGPEYDVMKFPVYRHVVRASKNYQMRRKLAA